MKLLLDENKLITENTATYAANNKEDNPTSWDGG